MTSDRRVVLTGMALLTPQGDDVSALVNAWKLGRTQFHTEGITGLSGEKQICGTCPDVDPKRLPDRKVQKAVTRRDVLGIIAATEAIRDANMVSGNHAAERFAMYVGAGSTQVCDLHPYYELVKSSDRGSQFDSNAFGGRLMGSVNPMVMLQTLMNNTLCYTSIAHDIRGVNANFMDFQVSGLRAVGEALWAIKTGRADIAVAGGLSGAPDANYLREGIDMGYLLDTRSLPNSAIENAMRPYDAERQGTILSEGAAFVVIEEEAAARRRGAKILARIHGYATRNDGGFAYIKGSSAPSLARAIDGATRMARCHREDLGWLIGHGNGAIAGDRSELEAYEKNWVDTGQKIAVTSPRSVTGDLSEAAPVASLIMATQAMQEGILPSTPNCTRADGEFQAVEVVTESRELPATLGCVTARSFSGISCALVFGRP